MAEVKRVKGAGSDKLKIAIADLGKKVGKVGWFSTSHYPDGTPVAYVAAIQEYGYKSIPPRLGMRATADQKRDEWSKIAESGAKAILAGTTSPQSVMELLGLKAAGDMRKHISTVTSPPLMPSTIRQRLSKKSNKKAVGSLTKPLVDTGILLGTLTNTVEDS